MLPRLSKFKQHLVLEIWDKDPKTLPEVLRQIDEFLETEEGVKKFHGWQRIHFSDSPEESGPKSIASKVLNIETYVSPIGQQGIRDCEGETE